MIRQALLDLNECDRSYRHSGNECMCDWGSRDHAATANICTKARQYNLLAARQWFEECSHDPGGFGWACDLLGWDAEAVARRILETGGELPGLEPRREMFA